MEREKSFNEGHRSRLRSKFLDGKLAEYELLELLLSYAIPRIDVKPIAKTLLDKFGNVHKVLAADISELQTVAMVGESAAILLRLVAEIATLEYKQQVKEIPVLHNPERLENYCRMILMGKATEEFHILYLDNTCRLIEDDKHSVGTLDNVAVYPREILKRALGLNAKFVILVHNHPNKNSFFSEKDIRITDEIKRVLGVVGIELMDHILVADGMVFSAKSSFLCR